MPAEFQECALVPGGLDFASVWGKVRSQLLGQNTTLEDPFCFLLADLICWLDRTIIVGPEGIWQCIPACFCSASSEAGSR